MWIFGQKLPEKCIWIPDMSRQKDIFIRMKGR